MNKPEADGLPDFIFSRQKAVEEANGFTLAGKLLTDISKHEDLSEHGELIFELIQRLKAAAHDPDWDEIGIWRNGKPPDALKGPFPDAAVLARAKRFHVVGVRVNPDGFLRIDDSQMADIMGRH